MEPKRKKALAVVAGPYRLLQVIWLTLLYKDYDWSLVLLRFGEDLTRVEELEKACFNSGIFENIYNAMLIFNKHSSVGVKVRETFKMVFYYLTGKKKAYCSKLILDSVGKFEYDLLCVACSYSFFEGAVLNFSSEIETIVIQEGMPDYIEGPVKVHGLVTNITGEILYRMGYVDLRPHHSFPEYKNCIKYACLPSKLKCKEFREIRKMFDSSVVDREEFHAQVQKIFPISLKKYNAVVFTAPLDAYGKKDGYPELIQYLEKQYKNRCVLIKKHPQDIAQYNSKEVLLESLFANVPGEIMLQYLSGTDIYFTFPSNMLIDVVGHPDIHYYVFHFNKGVNKEYEEGFRKIIRFLEVPKSAIIEL